MNIYLIWQIYNTDYDTFDSAIVAAENESEAKLIHPDNSKIPVKQKPDDFDTWCPLNRVQCRLIASDTKEPKGVILASFNAG